MTEFKKVLESNMKIRFHDCDPYNHLNNSRYIDYIMTARGDQLIESYGLDIYQIAREQGVGWVTAETQISYISPALVMEDVVIQTQLIGFSERSLRLEALMWNHDKSGLKVLMWTRLVHYNLRLKKSHVHHGTLMSLFSNIVNPLPVEMNFHARVNGIKESNAIETGKS